MSKTVLRPYLVTKSDDGLFRVTVRTTRFNSQGYPLVNSQVLEEEFASAARAKVWLKAEYQAEASDIATK